MDKFLSYQNSGSVHLIIGPMFAGKSSELMKNVRRLTFAKKKILVINFKADNRYTDKEAISTHDKIHMEAVKCEKIAEVKEQALDYDIIAIDEGQFFSDISEMSTFFADNGKIVIVAALDGTFQRKPFGNIHEMMPNCESITKLTAICIHCGHNACFTRRKIQNDRVQLIGSSDIYEPVCRGCFIQKNNEESQQSSDESILEKNSDKQEKASEDNISNNSSCQSPKNIEGESKKIKQFSSAEKQQTQQQQLE